jgi:hypothetical protein
MPVAISIHFLNVAILEAARSAALAARVFALDAASVVGDRPPCNLNVFVPEAAPSEAKEG